MQQELSSPRNALQSLIAPIVAFIRLEALSAILLVTCSVGALIIANSSYGELYFSLKEILVGFQIGPARLTKPLVLWINDALMAVFFFVIGLEIKREIIAGELSSLRRAALPIAGAIGGMVVPAIIYALIVDDSAAIHGWGIPMATDIAFSLGVLSLLGSRIHPSLKIFLAALAIVDDIGAIIVIAIFYTPNVEFSYLTRAGLVLALMLAMNLGNVRRPTPYFICGVLLWLFFLKSGLHATLAGVLAAFMIPASRALDSATFISTLRSLTNDLERESVPSESRFAAHGEQAIIHEIKERCLAAEAPLQRLEHRLHPLVAFGIIPIFAFINAGITIPTLSDLVSPHIVSIGIFFGLALGKPLGIVSFCVLAGLLRVVELPSGSSWRSLIGVSCLAGIGFTMSLFITELAFSDSSLVNAAKVGILGSTIVAAGLGVFILLRGGARSAR